MFCGNCGTNINDKDAFCPKCGAMITQSNIGDLNNSNMKKTIKKAPIIIAIIAVLLVTVVCLFLFVFNRKLEPEEIIYKYIKAFESNDEKTMKSLCYPEFWGVNKLCNEKVRERLDELEEEGYQISTFELGGNGKEDFLAGGVSYRLKYCYKVDPDIVEDYIAYGCYYNLSRDGEIDKYWYRFGFELIKVKGKWYIFTVNP